MNSAALHDAARSVLAKYVIGSDRLLVAVSGGPDSMSLLALLAGIVPTERLGAAYVDHGLRADTQLDVQAVCTLATRLGVRFYSERRPVRQSAETEHLSVEQAARIERYDALQKLAAANNFPWIVTGHTLDDSAETVIMRMQAGSPWYECTGIPERRGWILRPLLSVPRLRVHEYAERTEIPFVNDSTNSDVSFRRNAVRAELNRLTAEAYFEHTTKAAFLGIEIARYLRYIRLISYISCCRHETIHDPSSRGLEIDRILRYFNSLSWLPVEEAWARLVGDPEARLPSASRRQISQLVSSGQPESVLELPNGIRLVRRGGVVWVSRSASPKIEQRIGEQRTEIVEMSATLEIKSQNVPSALRVRNWRSGDRIQIANRPRKRVSDLLREMSLNPVERDQTLVLEDALGIAAIMGSSLRIPFIKTHLRARNWKLEWKLK